MLCHMFGHKIYISFYIQLFSCMTCAVAQIYCHKNKKKLGKQKHLL